MKRIVILLYISFLGLQAPAQQAFTNNGNLQIHTGASMTGFGDFTNASTAVLVNNGDYRIQGNLTNNQSAMSAGSGTLYLNGTNAQTVNGTQAFKTNNLVTDNTTGITLNANLSVAGTHTFTNGLITTSATPNYLVYEAGSSHTGSTDSRHVNGWVKKIGNTNFTFPVGDATYLRTIAISNLSATAEMNCHYYLPTQNIYNLTSPVVQVKSNEYWQLDQISGGTARVSLNWDHSKVPMDNILLVDILVSPYATGTWGDAGGATTATGNVTTTGSVTSADMSSFGPVTLGYTTFPVPLKLVSFSAERKPGVSFLHWISDNEQSVSHFEVQRSYDAVTYTTIGNVPARNTGLKEHYYFEDHSLLKGFAWYRIRSVDSDGKFSYTRIVVVSENLYQSGTFVVPNPVRHAITIMNKTGRDDQFVYHLYTAGGQLIIKGTVSMTSNGGTVIPLPLQTPAGIYVLELKNGTMQFSQKVLVEN